MKKFLAGIMLLILVSCTSTSPEQIEKLKRGMSIEETITVLGEPYTKEYRTDGCVLYYSYSDNWRKHHLYVYIENGKVIHWY